MDYKPRRSESEAPPGAYKAGKPVQTITNPDGTTSTVGHNVSAVPGRPVSEQAPSSYAVHVLLWLHVMVH